ncbi:MAG: ParB/RepB/Spo0J family partition protein [Thermoplasmata archaeon]
MAKEEVVFTKFEPELDISKIQLGPKNVRQTEPEAGLEDLKGSISRLGLIQPIVVIRKGDHYDLIAGQRRYLAFKEMNRPTIPALAIAPVTDLAEEMISFGENIHRRQLPYDDTIRVCDALYRNYTGTAVSRVKKIAQDLGVSMGTVSRYLSYRLVPDSVQRLVTGKKLSAQLAYRITSAFWPNVGMIEAIALEATRMTKPEQDRALEVGRKNPRATPKQVVEAARKVPVRFDVMVPIDAPTYSVLQREADKRKTDVAGLIRALIDRFVEEGEP